MVTTGFESTLTQTPPLPRPPATGISSKATTLNFARSASEPHREWIEQQVRLRRNAQANQHPVASIPGLVMTKVIARLDRGQSNPKDAADFRYLLETYAAAGNVDRQYGEEHETVWPAF
ncbi:hypothetical protein [Paraburkholderia aspalathi]|uniref:hypothetical protein n=1 Tax=Paraburkholderia aspalathi TaxID=1324617 RepID=UPI000A4E7494